MGGYVDSIQRGSKYRDPFQPLCMTHVENYLRAQLLNVMLSLPNEA